MAMAPPDELRHGGSAWLDHNDHHHNRTASFLVIFQETNAGDQPQQQHNSRRTAAAAAAVAAAVAAAAAAVRRGSRWRWRLRRQRCDIATVVDKISTEGDITRRQQRTRSHCRERGSAGSLAPTPEVVRTRHVSPATLWRLRIKVELCLPLPSTAHREHCLLCAAVWDVPSCPLIIVPLCLENNGVKLGICRPIV